MTLRLTLILGTSVGLGVGGGASGAGVLLLQAIATRTKMLMRKMRVFPSFTIFFLSGEYYVMFFIANI